jgi:hypothetical protein
MGEQGAGRVEKAWLESGADINQVCGDHSALSVVHLLFSSSQGGRNGYRLVCTLGKSSKVSVLSTNIREVMDYEPTDITAVIERMLLLNDAALPPPVLYAKRATSPLTSMSQGLKRRQLDRVDDPPFAVVIPLPPRHANSHMRLQTMSNTLSTTSEGQMRASSSQLVALSMVVAPLIDPSPHHLPPNMPWMPCVTYYSSNDRLFDLLVQQDLPQCYRHCRVLCRCHICHRRDHTPNVCQIDLQNRVQMSLRLQ